MANKKQHFNYYRLILQWLVLLTIGYLILLWNISSKDAPDFEKYCPFGGIQALLSYLKSNILACSMSSVQIVMGLTLLFGVLIFSKLFCSYICPIGTITEWLGKIGNKYNVLFTFTGIPDKILRIFKYGLLFITIYYTVESGELFCKKYDPFYALATWFSYDVNFYMAIGALVLTVLGSIFIRQFWCKYLCPLGAFSNLFSYFFAFLIVTIPYIILIYNGVIISWLYPLIVALSLSYLLEVFNLNRFVFPLFKITRNDDVCTHCKLCDKACPQGIQLSGGNTTIKHIDCNLCGNCLTVCPTYNTLKINHKRRINWLPSVATVILFVVAIYLSKTWDIPTVNERWGNKEDLKTALVFKKSGLKSIKCYGSCMSFVEQMKTINGIFGVEAFVNSKSVKVYYNPKIINEQQINEAIFTPVIYLISNPPDVVKKVIMATFHINNFFDSYDSYYLTMLFKQNEGIYGFKTLYGEPVIVNVYFDAKKFNADRIKSIIESKNITFKIENNTQSQDLNFDVVTIDKNVIKLSTIDFKHSMFTPFSQTFNDYDKYDSSKISIYEIEMPDATNSELVDMLPYLANHLSNDLGIISFETKFEETIPFAEIKYVVNMTNPDKIYKSLIVDSLNITFDNGEKAKEKNPYKFTKQGIVKDSIK